MLFKQVLKLENDKMSVLDQKKIISTFNNVDIYNYTVEYGGCTIIHDELWVNYAHNKYVLWYDINHIKLLIPQRIYNEEWNHLHKIFDIMDIDFSTDIAHGYWLDKEGVQILDYLEVVSFNITNLDKLNFFIKLASRLSEEYEEDCIALYVNDALLLIEGGLN